MTGKKKNLWKFFGSLLFFGYCSVSLAAVNGTIKGTVKESKTGEALMGANIILLGTSIGASTDLDGNYIIKNIPEGKYDLRVTYIGYQEQVITINISSDKTIIQNFKMESVEIESETVLVTAQRSGQVAAINKQLTSNAIKNIVSADKIEELPESNAAEAVGRLPGISILREGGEGSKVVIRGLAPKYNKIQIDGVNLAGTDSEDRSTDLSMISPYMLGGIEVSKSAMADQEADQLGGTVNFLTKGAPFEDPSYKIVVEGAYNGLRREYGDYKIAAQTSRRELNGIFGISLNLDVEKKNRSSNSVSAGYDFDREAKLAYVNSFGVSDITRKLNRYGGSLVMDYKTPSTTIIMSNMFSKIENENISRSESSSGYFGAPNRSQRLTYSQTSTTVSMNQIRLEQNFGNFNLDAGISYSYSSDKAPEILSYGGTENSPMQTGIKIPKSVKPEDVNNYLKKDVSTTLLGRMTDSEAFTKEDEFGSHLNLEWDHTISDLVSLKIKAGGKYKYKSREYDYNTIYLNIASDPSGLVTDAIVKKWPEMAKYSAGGKFFYEPFIDKDYDPGDFMAGQFKLERIPSLTLGKELLYYLKDYLGILTEGATVPKKFVPNFHSNKRSDYHGNEKYLAFYILPTISIGQKMTIIPGLRYEKNTTSYYGVRGNANLQVTESMGFWYTDTTVTRNDQFYLPMIHARYKLTDWFDIRASYTHTLARPSYVEFIPSWYIAMLSIDYRNPNLKTALSKNYDLYFSFYGNKIGLFTVGLFSKSITDLVFWDERTILSKEEGQIDYGLVKEYTGQDLNFTGKKIGSFVNNPNKTKVKGIEIEWQSNLWYLPGLLKNIVFGINYTFTNSEVLYPRTVPIKKIVQGPFGPRETIVGNADSSFIAPLLLQPDHILNITLGYDYLGFSIRGSMQFKSKIFSSNNWRPELRGYTDPFTLFDLSVSQKLPLEGLVLFGNLNNYTKAMETSINSGTGFFTSKQYYGLSGALGVKYQF